MIIIAITEPVYRHINKITRRGEMAKRNVDAKVEKLIMERDKTRELLKRFKDKAVEGGKRNG